jgi:hypothetical protein
LISSISAGTSSLSNTLARSTHSSAAAARLADGRCVAVVCGGSGGGATTGAGAIDVAPALTGGDSARYLAMNLDMERQIHEISAVCDYVQGLQKSPKRLWLSFDEWNVWYRARGGRFANGQRAFAPHLLEEMLHLGIVCNLLTTFEGTPKLATALAVPKYPGPLPGDVRPNLTVYLSGLTRQLVKEVYMEIEYPQAFKIIGVT